MIPRWTGILPPLFVIVAGFGALLFAIGLAEKEIGIMLVSGFLFVVALSVASVGYYIRRSMLRSTAPIGGRHESR